MKILVAGKNGQVSTELGLQGANSRHSVITLAHGEMDIRDRSQVRGIVIDIAPDIIINAAAYTAVDKAEEESDAAFAVNRDGPANLAQAASEISVPLLHISTDYIFDGSKREPYIESDTPAPLGVYGNSKLEGERAVRETVEQHIILRTSWVFSSHGQNFFKTMLRLAQTRDELRVVSDQLGGPTSAAGIASCLLKICDLFADKHNIPWGTYHYSGEPFVSWFEFARAIISQGRKHGLIDHEVTVLPISTAEFPTKAKRPANSRLSCELITEKLGIRPDDWQAALENAVQKLGSEHI